MIRLVRLRTQFFKQLEDIDLWFPPTCRILISGKNEAGKSSLFEAVYFGLFGDALVTEEGRGRLDDLLTYGKDEGYVELWLDLPGRQMQIRRRLRRSKANEWEVDVLYPNGKDDPVRGNTTTNHRIVTELGFDRDTLLNTCLIEQKKLDRLEGLSSTQREASLKRLLNLDALVRLENELKVRREDELALERLRQRAELAALQVELPGREEALADLDARLQRVSAYAAALKARDELQAALALESALVGLRADRDARRQRAAQAEALREAMTALKEAMTALERAAEQEIIIAGLRQEQAAAQALAETEQPRVQARLRAASRLLARLQRLATLDAARHGAEQTAADLHRRADQARQAADELARARIELAEAETAAAQASHEQADLDSAYQAAREAEVLDAWLRANERVTAPERHATALQAARQRRADLTAEFRAAAEEMLKQVSGATAGNNEGTTGIQRLLASIRHFVHRALELWNAFSQASDELVELEAARQAQATLARAGREELSRVSQRARSLKVEPPISPDEARDRLNTARSLTAGQTAEVLEVTLGQARQRRGAADGRLVAARDGLDRLASRAAEDPAALTAEAEAQSTRAARLMEILQRWQLRAEEAAATLGLSPEPGACQVAVGRLRARADFIAQELAKAARIPAQIEERQAEVERFRRQAEASFTTARARAELPPWRPDLTPAEVERLGKALRQRYDELGGRQAQDDYNQAEAAVQRAEAERDGHRRASQEATAQLHTLVGDAKLKVGGWKLEVKETPTSNVQLDAIIQALADVAREDPRLLSRQRDEVQARVGFLREQRARLVKALGIGSGETLDLAECRAALAGKERDIEVRRRALSLVQDTSRSLLEAVLPATVDRMTRLLPALTVNRYFDAYIRPDDWKIRVWDERAPADDKAQKWRTKNIFSGGTRDQFSLALRLAFALAALPEERGSAPGFLFLDEPLSAFDAERAQALIALLNEGEIAANFDQILLISHVPVDRSVFTHHVTLEGGRVVESDLPGGEDP